MLEHGNVMFQDKLHETNSHPLFFVLVQSIIANFPRAILNRRSLFSVSSLTSHHGISNSGGHFVRMWGDTSNAFLVNH